MVLLYTLCKNLRAREQISTLRVVNGIFILAIMYDYDTLLCEW
jgi:hypothetical protein